MSHSDSLDGLVSRWRTFATSLRVTWKGSSRTWAEHLSANGGRGFADEAQLVQRSAFQSFANDFLDFQVGHSLATELASPGGVPDYSPSDARLHPFVFECKGTDAMPPFAEHQAQISRYLTTGKNRVQHVVLVTMRHIAVYGKDAATGAPVLESSVNLASLLGEQSTIYPQPQAEALQEIVRRFGRMTATPEEKLRSIREAEKWNHDIEVSSHEAMIECLRRVYDSLYDEARQRVAAGGLSDRSVVSAAAAADVLDELHALTVRLAIDGPPATIEGFLEDPAFAEVVAQYVGHVALFTTVRLFLLRAWEDLGIIEQPILFDGGFDSLMSVFDNRIEAIVDHAFNEGRRHYGSLFSGHPTYEWFRPSATTLADALYALATTYFGRVASDALGVIYERMLTQIDRTLLGIYYTPRDIIRLMLEMVRFDAIADAAEDEGRAPRVLDVATGSGGFLVEATSFLRARFEADLDDGSTLSIPSWIAKVADGMNGIEYQRFSAFLAEVNLVLVASGLVATRSKHASIPEFGVITGDTLTFHEPTSGVLYTEPQVLSEMGLQCDRIKDVDAHKYAFDLAIGNPPYIGEKAIARTIAVLKERYPYWRQFSDSHVDYLYFFLILGVSKLRRDGRFAFITTEYWLRTSSASKLRGYLAEHCEIERLVLFRGFLLFPAATGQQSMVIVGRRVTDRDGSHPPVATKPPIVTVYTGRNTLTPDDRYGLLSAIAKGSLKKKTPHLSTFRATLDPRALGSASWDSLAHSKEQNERRERLLTGPQLAIETSEGIVPGAKQVAAKRENLVRADILRARGWPTVRPGIFTLSALERKRLDTLTPAEEARLRPEVTTESIFPYAVVLDDDTARYTLYLTANDVEEQHYSTRRDIIEYTPFPSGMPAFEKHLRPYKDLLVDAVTRFNRRRPWWTIHDAREDFLASRVSGRPYCVVAQRGAGGRFIVGLSEPKPLPTSGANLIVPRDPSISSAYLAGVYNSSLFQEIADSVPPGNVHAGLLRSFGMPLVTSVVDEITTEAYALQGVVRKLATTIAARFPDIRRALKDTPALREFAFTRWTPRYVEGPGTGTVATVWWTLPRFRAAATGGIRNVVRGPQEEVGRTMIAVEPRSPGSRPWLVSIASDTPSSEVHDEFVAAFCAFCRGRASGAGGPATVSNATLPTNPGRLLDRFRDDTQEAQGLIDEYMRRRQKIDDLLGYSMVDVSP